MIRKLVFGIGFNNANYPTRDCIIFQRWKNMLQRCYSEKYITQHSSYVNCIVCDEWLIFTNFAKWMKKQDYKEKDLDKDILFPNNVIYSPNTCCFIDKKLNRFFTSKTSNGGNCLSKGVCYVNNMKSYRSNIRFIFNNELKFDIKIGYFKTEIEASIAYNKERIKIIKAIFHTQNKNIKLGLNRHINALQIKNECLLCASL